MSLDIGKVWRIVPCVYKIYTLGRFQFHNLLRRNLVIRAAGPSNPVLLSFSVAPLGGTAYGAIVRARPPAAAPAGGGVACRVPAPGLPPSSSMPRGPPPRPPLLFPEDRAGDGNRMGMDSCAPVCPTAASGPGFHVRWPPSGPRVSARAIPVTAGGLGLPADARVPPLSIHCC